MPEHSLISIIIPAYNSGDTLAAALRSIQQQSYPRLEVLLMDGGSTDNTIALARDARLGSLRIFSERDSGIYDAINKGLDRAEGEWIYVLGSDDALAAPEVMESLVASVRPGDQFVCGCIENLGVGNRFVPVIHCSGLTGAMRWRNQLHQQSVIYHRSVFDGKRFDTRYRVLADYDLHIRMWKEGLNGRSVRLMVAKCAASGLSKRFGTALYREEILIKWRRFNTWEWMLNIPWIAIKFLAKTLGRKRS